MFFVLIADFFLRTDEISFGNVPVFLELLGIEIGLCDGVGVSVGI